MQNSIRFLMLMAIMIWPMAAQAETLTCEDGSGDCEIDAQGATCDCADGSSVAMEMVGEGSEMDVTEAMCLEILLEACGGREITGECDSDKGACVVYSDGSSFCECADGSGAGSGESSEGSEGGEDPVYPTDPDDDAATEAPRARVWLDEALTCDMVLADACPNDPPNPADECTTQALTVCNSLGDWMAECYEQTVWAYMIVECCNEFEESAEVINDIWSCLDGKSCVDGAEACFEEIGEAEDALYGGDRQSGDANDDSLDGVKGEESDDDDEDDKSSGSGSDDEINCANTGAPASLLLLLTLLALAWRRRQA